MRKFIQFFFAFVCAFGLVGCETAPEPTLTMESVPTYSDQPYVVLGDNDPSFTEEEITTESFETYYPLDGLGRATGAFASLGTDLLPTKERGNISSVKPTGWHSVKYDFVDGKNLYNRCHLIAWSLSGEDANPNNLITGTRYLNIKGMLPFEDMVRDYVKETGNHVMYRVTPIYEGDDLVASGVEMEGYSVEDEGEGISFHVYCYNVQPGVEIDYETGESWAVGEEELKEEKTEGTYVLNTKTKKIHLPSCSNAQSIKEENKEYFRGDPSRLLEEGYVYCQQCLKGQ